MPTETADELQDRGVGGTFARETEWEHERCQDSHGKRSRGVETLATNTRPVTLGTMVEVSTWTSDPLVEQHHTTKEV